MGGIALSYIVITNLIGAILGLIVGATLKPGLKLGVCEARLHQAYKPCVIGAIPS